MQQSGPGEEVVLEVLEGMVLHDPPTQHPEEDFTSALDDSRDVEQAGGLTRSLPASFQAHYMSITFRLLVWGNALLLGLVPVMIVITVPPPKGWEEQGVFWKEKPALVFLGLIGLLFSLLVTSNRIPATYRITRTKLNIVSYAKTRWWYSPCYTCCAPGYSINLADILSAEVSDPPCLAPPLLVAPPRTTNNKKMCVVTFKNRCFCNALSWTQRVWLTPMDPKEFAATVTKARQEDWKGSLLPQKIKTRAKLPQQTANKKVMSLPPAGVTSTAPSREPGEGKSVLGPGSDWKSIQSDVELIKYRLQGTETLEGLALKFSCQVDDIKRANGMGPSFARSQLAAYSNLWIPLRATPAAGPGGPST